MELSFLQSFLHHRQIIKIGNCYQIVKIRIQLLIIPLNFYINVFFLIKFKIDLTEAYNM